MRAYWFLPILPSWEALFKFMINRLKLEVEQLDTS